jgi:hypothetical protein
VLELADGLVSRELLRSPGLFSIHVAAGAEVTVGVLTTLVRAGKGRLGEVVDPPAGTKPPFWSECFRRDPDGLARALSTSGPVVENDSWDVDPKALLHLFVGDSRKLVTEGTSAKATLESIAAKKNGDEAKVKLEAVIVHRDPALKDVHDRLKVWATLRGPLDGSGPPRKETVEVQELAATGRKRVVKYEVVRTPTAR